jgi:hypothetical protein
MPQVIQIDHQSEHEHRAKDDPHFGNVRKPLAVRPQESESSAGDCYQPDARAETDRKMTDPD